MGRGKIGALSEAYLSNKKRNGSYSRASLDIGRYTAEIGKGTTSGTGTSGNFVLPLLSQVSITGIGNSSSLMDGPNDE